MDTYIENSIIDTNKLVQIQRSLDLLIDKMSVIRNRMDVNLEESAKRSVIGKNMSANQTAYLRLKTFVTKKIYHKNNDENRKNDSPSILNVLVAEPKENKFEKSIINTTHCCVDEPAGGPLEIKDFLNSQLSTETNGGVADSAQNISSLSWSSQNISQNNNGQNRSGCIIPDRCMIPAEALPHKLPVVTVGFVPGTLNNEDNNNTVITKKYNSSSGLFFICGSTVFSLFNRGGVG